MAIVYFRRHSLNVQSSGAYRLPCIEVTDGFVKTQIAATQLQRLWVSRSRVGLAIYRLSAVPGDAHPRPHSVNHCFYDCGLIHGNINTP